MMQVQPACADLLMPRPCSDAQGPSQNPAACCQAPHMQRRSFRLCCSIHAPSVSILAALHYRAQPRGQAVPTQPL